MYRENHFKLKYLFFIISIAIFIYFAINVYLKKSIDIDNIFNNLLLNDTLTNLMVIVTEFGSASFLIIITLIFGFFLKDKKISVLILCNLLCSFLLNQLFKIVFLRPRPLNIHLLKEPGYSFPSGHSMIGLAFYGFLIYLANKKIKNKYLRISIELFLGLLILSIGFSRIYLRVHYPSDVIAGFSISFAYLILYISFIKQYFKEDLWKSTIYYIAFIMHLEEL